MTASTPRYAIPYPLGTDRVMDGDNVMQAIAERVEAILAPVDDRSLTVPSGFRNVIRNGDMGIGQRGPGPFTVTGVYTLDGWRKDHVGGTHTVTNAAVALGALAGGAGGWLQSVVAGQSAAADYASLIQRVESVRTLAGRQATVSFVAAAASGTPKVGVEVIQGFGTGGSPSAVVFAPMGAVTLSTTPTRYALTFTVPSIAGKTAGTAGGDYLAVNLWLSSGADNAGRASNIGIQNATITLTDVQLEAGPTATPFERLPAQQQLAWCQRYFYRLAGATGVWQIHGHCTAATSANFAFRFPVPMRAVIAALTVAGSWIAMNNAGGNVPATAVAFGGASTDGALIVVTTASGLVAGNVTTLVGATGASIDFSAEL